MEYENYKDFFEKVGEDVLHPQSYGECLWPVTVEEMYQHFKARMIDELHVTSDELLRPADVKEKNT